VRDSIWDLYRALKTYKLDPKVDQKEILSKEFDRVFTIRTSSTALNELINRTHKNKEKLLKVLDYPHIPLHNNDSERDIREYVKKRKISGGSRSAAGRRARDTPKSLKKTCRKLGVPTGSDTKHWSYTTTCSYNQGAQPKGCMSVKLGEPFSSSLTYLAYLLLLFGRLDSKAY